MMVKTDNPADAGTNGEIQSTTGGGGAEFTGAAPSFDPLFELSIDMLCVAGFDGYFKRINPRWTQVLGYTAEELCARPFVEFVHPEDVASTVAAAGQIGQGDAIVTFENRYRAVDGSYRWLQWCAGPDMRNQLIYAVARDVSELKRIERKQQEQLAREAHQQGSLEMAAGILHDLGNAFTGIGTRAVELQTRLDSQGIDKNLKRLAGFLREHEQALAGALGATKARALAELAEAIATENEKGQKAALESANKLMAFVGHGQDLITTYRAYSGAGVAPGSMSLSVQKLILDAQLMMGDGIAKRGITLDLKCDPNLPSIHAERTKIMQVLINVLKNATEAFDDVKATMAPFHISVSAKIVNRGITIEVLDNARGIDPEELSRVFDDGFSTKGRGSGVGLGATRRVVASLGGQISLTSDGIGKGARATIWLPVGEAKHDAR